MFPLKECKMNYKVLSHAFEKAKDGFIILNADNIVFCNKSCRKLFSIPQDYYGLSIYDFSTNKKIINGLLIDFDKIVFDDFVKGEKRKIEWEFYTQQGRSQFVLVDIQKIDKEGNVMVVLKNISNRKKYDLMLEARMNLVMHAQTYSLPKLYSITLDRIASITESQIGFYYLISGDELKLVASVGSDNFDAVIKLHESCSDIDQTITSLYKLQKPLLNNKLKDKTDTGLSLWNTELSSEMLIPVFHANKIVALVGLANKPRSYNSSDAELSKTLVEISWNIADKRLTEMALAESETRFANVFDSTSFGVLVCEINGKILNCNQAFLKITDYTVEEIANISFFDLFHPDKPMDLKTLERLIDGNIPNFKSEQIFVNRHNDIIWVNTAISVQNGNGSENKILLCVIEDIIEKKHNLFNLEKSEERFKLLSSIASEGICIHDNGVILEGNEALAKLIGMPCMSDLIGKNFFDFEFLADESRTALRERMRTKKFGICDIVIKKKDSEVVYLEMSDKDFFYNGRNVRLGTIRDVTEQKKSEIALKESERNFREFFDNSIILQFVFLENGKILKANKHACGLLGYSLEEIQQKTIFDLVSRNKEQIEDEVGEIIKGNKSVCNVPFVKKNGNILPMSTHVGVGRWNNKKALFCVGKDLTELRLSEEKFNKAFHKNGMAMIISSTDNFEIIDANQKALNILGYTYDEFIGSSFLFKKLSCSSKQFDELIEQASKGEINDLTFRLCKNNGEKIITTMNTAKFEIHGKSFYLISFLDVTEKIEIARALKESESRLSEITENVQEGIILANMDFKYVFVNNTYSRMTGYSKEELLNMRISDMVVYPDDFKMARKLVDEGGSIAKRYVALRKRNGDFFYISVSAKRIKIGNEYFILGAQQDVTQEYLAEQKLIKAYEEISSLKNQLEQENIILRQEINKNHTFNEVVTENESFHAILKKIETVAPTNASVLISGETGTGKELIARAIHEKSKRSKKPMVKLNCAAIPESLIESELFGHEKGAFTGAVQQKIGRFEVANGGTLFLDEIGELPFDLQSKLLRVLQEGEFERIGGTKTIKVDVRIIAATNRELINEIENGNFRLDLYYRLNVFPVEIPPLRERIDDISLLTNHFVKKFNKKLDKNVTQIPVKVMNLLTNYDWPGNIRELENVIERAMILSNGHVLNLELSLNEKNHKEKQRFISFQEMQKQYIEDVLNFTNWKLSGNKSASEILDLKYTTLTSKMQRLGIKKVNHSD